ncbi:unnamed protein product [Owenia fusiformis]|uniref:Uncharacterized protein n=1 Tax=Owenia fusiformis TaxID=6347 RepID=A0A8J1TC88_OWEFU|nr:unnamed protein product [Owenia fusiformis]
MRNSETTYKMSKSICFRNIQNTICAIILLAIQWELVNSSTCTRPVLGLNMYSLSINKTTYAQDEMYDVVCSPGYGLDAGLSITGAYEATMTCTAAGTWDIGVPECFKSEGSYPWYVLFIGVLCGLLVIVCILPRIWYCCFPYKVPEGKLYEKGRRAGTPIDTERQEAFEWGRDDYDSEAIKHSKKGLDF